MLGEIITIHVVLTYTYRVYFSGYFSIITYAKTADSAYAKKHKNTKIFRGKRYSSNFKTKNTYSM